MGVSPERKLIVKHTFLELVDTSILTEKRNRSFTDGAMCFAEEDLQECAAAMPEAFGRVVNQQVVDFNAEAGAQRAFSKQSICNDPQDFQSDGLASENERLTQENARLLAFIDGIHRKSVKVASPKKSPLSTPTAMVLTSPPLVSQLSPKAAVQNYGESPALWPQRDPQLLLPQPSQTQVQHQLRQTQPQPLVQNAKPQLFLRQPQPQSLVLNQKLPPERSQPQLLPHQTPSLELQRAVACTKVAAEKLLPQAPIKVKAAAKQQQPVQPQLQTGLLRPGLLQPGMLHPGHAAAQSKAMPTPVNPAPKPVANIIRPTIVEPHSSAPVQQFPATISLASCISDTSSVAGNPTDKFTTVMLRNVPNTYTRGMLVDMLNSEGFAGKFEFVYLPIDFKTHAGLGYAFVDCCSPQEAQKMRQHFEGFLRWAVKSEKICSVSWSHPEQQGIDSHIERYRNSPIMHESVNDEWKPALFSKGLRVPFPPPTTRLRAPRIRSPRRGLKNGKASGI
jgi:hypothetical protein